MASSEEQPKIASALSELIDSSAAVAECVEKLRADLDGRRPDALFLFVSPHHRDAYALIQESLLHELRPSLLLGCSGGGVIGGARELEESPGLSVTAAAFPGVALRATHINDEDLPGPDDPPRSWELALGVAAAERPGFITLVSPFMGRSEDLLMGLDYAFPQSQKVGGVVSGLRHVGERALFLDGQRFSDGAIVLSLSGPLRMDTLVAQGCRPVGPLFTVTSCQGNVIETLDKKSALKAVQTIFEGVDARTKDLLQRALFVGLVGDNMRQGEPQAGDFLIRNVMGFDERGGNVAVAAFVREGMRLRFHVRDAEAADEDLRKVMARSLAAQPERKVAGALLFSCVGRGERLFSEPDHDSQAFARVFGSEAVGGFFCNGEIGPVGGGTYLHGFTSCFAVFSRA
ncbi:MAG TPA: FIST N-terminal domain-containing protein [bacterium]|jgi:small ligand-binding sensory domain FIST|nr:FIST N-terminal domain-containing protein [bacterium]